METTIRLHWIRSGGADHGTLHQVGELDPSIQSEVLAQIGGEAGVFHLKLPFFDRRDLRRKTELLRDLRFERHGNWIIPVLPLTVEVRTLAADLALTNPLWIRAGQLKQPFYFRTWRRVSCALQRSMRDWISAIHFSDLRAYDDRERACAMLLYQAARPFYGEPSYDFTLDLCDYPESMESLELAWKLAGSSLRRNLQDLERHFLRTGHPHLAKRYSERWTDDIFREVRKEPKIFARLIIKEAAVINSMIDMASVRTPYAVTCFSKSVNSRLRNVCGRDLRYLALAALRTATDVLRRQDSAIEAA
jgi:hypothetical protein